MEQPTTPLPQKTLQKITFVEHDGTTHEVLTAAGRSAMEVAVDDGVPGIVGECGGCCSCATCHGYVDEAWTGKLPPASEAELELVSFAFDPLPNSRLTCQIILTPELDGIVIRMPRRQL